ncbi:hypothetical protein [Flavonifractor sp. An91]|uniref:hypothetical protein n=1 Tax=Flavonifractor sp. An91 TaxID=1965665 RepID=UPI000B3857E1|nr:hypothetical protein [Flavonifractor sp. An91]OUN13291.1 hypothetical protein B5G42_04715 [Flavonifractor sp. An91]
MYNKFDYKDILMTYGAMMMDAPTKKKGATMVKKDWEIKKQQMEVSIDTALVDVGIRMMTVSKKRFDMKKFLETGEFPTYNGCYVNGLDDVISLFKILETFKEDSSVKECLDKIMGLWSENLGSMTIFNRETFLNEVMDNITDLKSLTLQELFDYYLSFVFDFDLGELLGFDSVLTDEEFDIWKDFSNQYSIAITMRYMYSDLYNRLKKSVFGDYVE